MHLDVERARAAVGSIATRLAITLDEAAAGILRVANANMQRAIRAVSIERGYDPREFALVAFGGCGGLHACELAVELGIRGVLVPQFAEGLSALGMLLADRVRDYAAGVLNRPGIEQRFRTLERRARRQMPGARIERLADYRYAGQSYEITLPWQADFHAAHQKMYGYSDPSQAIEVVTIRVRATRSVAKPTPAPVKRIPVSVPRTRRIYTGGAWRKAKVFERTGIPTAGVAGPALVTDYGSTTLIPPGWRMKLDRAGNLLATATPSPPAKAPGSCARRGRTGPGVGRKR